MSVVVYPYAKINIGLHVLEKRADGYHNIETVFYPAPLCDILEIAQAGSDTVRIFLYGKKVPGSTQDNLCLQAYRMLSEDYSIAPIDFHLYKNIPAGAGLGGGSSDGAFALMALNKWFSLGLSLEQLREYGARLGSDVPFFIGEDAHRAVFATGRGTELYDLNLDLSAFRVEVRVPEQIHISTSEAYGGVRTCSSRDSLRAILAKYPVSQWKDHVFNDFEPWVFERYPILKHYKQDFYEQGAVYASLTGSGAAVFGLFAR